MKKKAVISLSGGQDSTSLLIYLLSRGYEVKAYAFKYGQKHQIEVERAQEIVDFFQSHNKPVTFQAIDLTDCFSESASSLCGDGGEIPKDEEYNLENQKSTVVENRNIIFSSIIYGKALAWSKKTDSDVLITLGIHANDSSTYPDTRPESQRAARKCFEISNWGSERVKYKTPFVKKEKWELLKAGLDGMKKMKLEKDIDYVYAKTLSCYDPVDGRACGHCATCLERLDSWSKNNRTDPAEYVK